MRPTETISVPRRAVRAVVSITSPPPYIRSNLVIRHRFPLILLAAALAVFFGGAPSAQAQQASNPVRNLTLTQSGLSSLTAAWDSPASGDVLYYQVRVTDNDTDASVDRTIVYSGRSAEAGNLSSGKSYTVSVGVWFRGGSGFGDETSATITLSDGGVENLAATAISQDTISVSWERPAFPRRIRWYVVGVFDKSSNKRVAQTSLTSYESGTEISGLTSETSYEVCIHIVEYGGGMAFHPTKSVEVTTLPAPPGPVQNLQLEANGNKIIVTWDAPASGGTPTRYRVTIQDGEGSKYKIRRPGPKKQRIIFRNLASGKTYQISVVAKNKAGKSEPTSSSVTLE